MENINTIQEWIKRAQSIVEQLPVEKLFKVTCYLVLIRHKDLTRPLEGKEISRGQALNMPPFLVKLTRTGLKVECCDGKNRWACSVKINTSISRDDCFLGVFSSEKKAKKWAEGKLRELENGP